MLLSLLLLLLLLLDILYGQSRPFGSVIITESL
jgi:hypothetical protein